MGGGARTLDEWEEAAVKHMMGGLLHSPNPADMPGLGRAVQVVPMVTPRAPRLVSPIAAKL